MRRDAAVLALALVAVGLAAGAGGASSTGGSFDGGTAVGPDRTVTPDTAGETAIDGTVGAAADRQSHRTGEADRQSHRTGEAAAAPQAHRTGEAAADRRNVSSGGADAPTVEVTQSYRMTADEQILVTLTFDDTDGLEDAMVIIDEGLTVRSADGFESRDDGPNYDWDGRSDDPELTYRINVTAQNSGLRVSSIHEGDWAVLDQVRSSASVLAWAADEDTVLADVSYDYAVEGEGRVVNDGAVVLGDYSTTERTVDGQTVEVVVPGDVEPRFPGEFTAGLLANASREVSAGEDDRVTGIVVPYLGALTHGIAIGDRTFMVVDSAETMTWVHEYVHTQQEYGLETDMRWFTEGSAQYYGYQVALEYGYADWNDFQYGMLLQTTRDESVLAEPDTWETSANYDKGAATVDLLDREIRETTDGDRTFAAVFGRLNRQSEPLTVETLVDIIADVGDDSVGETARQYVTTEAVPPEEWDRSAFERAYGFEPAQIATERLRLTGEGVSGNRTLPVEDQHVNVTTGERVRLEFTVENQGETTPKSATV